LIDPLTKERRIHSLTLTVSTDRSSPDYLEVCSSSRSPFAFISKPSRRRIDVFDCSSLSNFGYIILGDQNVFEYPCDDDDTTRRLTSLYFTNVIFENWDLPAVLCEFDDSCVFFVAAYVITDSCDFHPIPTAADTADIEPLVSQILAVDVTRPTAAVSAPLDILGSSLRVFNRPPRPVWSAVPENIRRHYRRLPS
jgi:hypothetical protein